MDEIAEKLFDYLPEDGSKVSGGQVKEALEISSSEYRKAKAELSSQGVVELGRGRGGTIARIEGAERPTEAPKITKAQKMQFAREARIANVRQRRLADKLRAAAQKIAFKSFPDAEKIDIQIWSLDQGHVYVYPWYNGTAQAYGLWIDTDNEF